MGDLKSVASETIPLNINPNTGIIFRQDKQDTSSVIIRQELEPNSDLVVSVQSTRPNTEVIETRQTFIPQGSKDISVKVPEFKSIFVISY